MRERSQYCQVLNLNTGRDEAATNELRKAAGEATLETKSENPPVSLFPVK